MKIEIRVWEPESVTKLTLTAENVAEAFQLGEMWGRAHEDSGPMSWGGDGVLHFELESPPRGAPLDIVKNKEG